MSYKLKFSRGSRVTRKSAENEINYARDVTICKYIVISTKKLAFEGKVTRWQTAVVEQFIIYSFTRKNQNY